MKVVIDTNLLIDGSNDDYNFGSRIIDDVISGKLEAFANRKTLAENQHMARRKISDENYLEKLNTFFAAIQPVESDIHLDVVEDYDDNKILESAVAADCEYLITSDNHLLKLQKYDNVKIVTPSAFWGVYQEENGNSWKQWLNDFIN
jgi:putative PIN family toxin of toxin-antitoxin system